MDISVIIPTYNRYEVLQRALRSVYAQSYPPKEVIVVDDGSNDQTSEIQEEFPSIKYIYQHNGGVSSARNTGIEQSSCEWLTFLDSDDIWHREKLREQVKFHQANKNIYISYTDEKWIRNDKIVNLPKKYAKHGGMIFQKCLSHCIIAPSSVIIHRSVLDDVGLFDESLEVCEDYDLWLRIASMYEIGLLDKKLITKYGGGEDQLSMKHWGMDRFRVRALEKLFFQTTSDKNFLLRDTLVHKYRLLLKGAQKYDKISEVKYYEEKIDYYEIRYNIE